VTSYNMETVLLNHGGIRVARGEWESLLRDLMSLADTEAKKITPPLTVGHQATLRSAAMYLGRGLHIRNMPDATYVWLGDSVLTVAERRRRKKSGIDNLTEQV
jgi:hypothetical protein